MILAGTFHRHEVFPVLKLAVIILILEALKFERAEGFERDLVILVYHGASSAGQRSEKRGVGRERDSTGLLSCRNCAVQTTRLNK